MSTANPAQSIRACAACKEKKVRCLMSDRPPWVCRRCTQKRLECVIPELQPRVRKKKVYERRIEQLERHVETVMSMLEKPISGVTVSVSRPSDSPPMSSSPVLSSHKDVISDHVVTIEEAHSLLEEYKDMMANNLPYVVLPDDISLSDLRQDRPMLLLATLVTASWRNRKQQRALNDAYLELFSSKLVLEGCKDLDTLQGLLVYLNWIHLHIASKGRHVYRLVSIAATIAIDLGITRRPRKGQHQKMNVESIIVMPKGLIAMNAEFWNREAQRAYLGCYQFATWYSILTRKPSPLPYNDYLYSCARSLATTQEYPADAHMVYRLELDRETERVYDIFNYAETNQPQNMSDDQLQLYLNAFSSRINEWRMRMPSSLSDNPCQKLWSSIFEAFAREVGLHGLPTSSTLSIPRTKVLLDCLMHTKDYLDTFLTIPLDKLASLTSTQWALLHYAILLATTVAMSMKTPAWNSQGDHTVIKLETYIDAVSARLLGLSSKISLSGVLVDWYAILLVRWDAIKTNYLAFQQKQAAMQPPRALIPAELSQGASGMDNQLLTDQPWLKFTVGDGMSTAVPEFELLDFADNVGPWMSNPYLFSSDPTTF